LECNSNEFWFSKTVTFYRSPTSSGNRSASGDSTRRLPGAQGGDRSASTSTAVDLEALSFGLRPEPDAMGWGEPDRGESSNVLGEPAFFVESCSDHGLIVGRP
jgi:hypothetical protein